MINARAESLAEKPSFRNAYRRRRCLVLADGFYEWKKQANGMGKLPLYIQLKSGEPFMFAGLWENWTSSDGSEVRSCTIITTRPSEFMKSIHNRMPVILSEQHYDFWLSKEEMDPESLNPLLKPYTEKTLHAFPVSREVNNPRNDVPECVKPISL
jgi:putative SOS response-associated peptidase YedK